jgi:hypothetical protein
MAQDITFRLAAPLPTLNRWERMHWRERHIFKRFLATEVMALTAGMRPAEPWQHVAVLVFRHSIGTPDGDNTIAKALLDVLQPPSKRHPYGLGIIAGDDPAHCRCSVKGIKVRFRPDQCTRVVIRELSAADFEPVREAAE